MNFGFGKKEEPADEVKKYTSLGIGVGSAIKLDLLDWKLLAAELEMQVPDEDLIVTQVGVMKLSHDGIAYRFYNHVGDFLQIFDENGIIDEITMFVRHDSVFPDDWDFWIGDDPMIGQQEFEIKSGTNYRRLWDTEKEDAVSPWTATEIIDDNITVEHQSMLYGRHVRDDLDDIELLLVGAEDRGETASVELYLGREIQRNNITVF